jgi:ATP-dependent RNA helicase RhlE
VDFYNLELSDNVLDALDDMRFETCTPIQEKCIPEILNGRDVIGVAQTGTGKTAAYLLPILSILDEGEFSKEAINCLVMSPTRELAQQIDQAMQGFAYYLNDISSVAVYGGNDGNRYDQEKKSLALGADVIIATPGRLISHLSLGNIDMSHVSFFVLDEADRMLDMGFNEDIMQIKKYLPNTCQTIMFSATMPKRIQELAKSLLHNPIEVKLSVSKPAEKIKQSAYVCYETQKMGIIKHLFQKNKPKRVIIFSGSKIKVKEIQHSLIRMGINSGEMHSDLSQAERDDIMYKFKSGQIDILVATDIVARGIDIDDITMVINYDVPHDSEDYVHRIGRTARADRDGIAITFISDTEVGDFKQIEKFLEKEIEKTPLPKEVGEGPAYVTLSSHKYSYHGKHSNHNKNRNRPDNGDRQKKKTKTPNSTKQRNNLPSNNIKGKTKTSRNQE